MVLQVRPEGLRVLQVLQVLQVGPEVRQVFKSSPPVSDLKDPQNP
jgi:hypothetical protein